MSSCGWEGVTWLLEGLADPPATSRCSSSSHLSQSQQFPRSWISCPEHSSASPTLGPARGKPFPRKPGGFVPTFPAPNTTVLWQLEHFGAWGTTLEPPAFPTCPEAGLSQSLGNVWPSFLLVPQCGALVFSVCP